MSSIDNHQLQASDEQSVMWWLALWRIKGVGPALYRRILEYFQDPAEVFYQSPNELHKLGFSQQAVKQIQDFVQQNAQSDVFKGVQADLRWLAKPNHHVIRCTDPSYPVLLRATPDYPPVLFVSGNPAYLSEPQVAVVGSRHASQNGLDIARSFAGQLALSNFIPTSGLALGVDAAGHQGAIEHGFPTIAVLGHGLHKVYPASNKLLAKAIVRKGAVVSEFPIGVEPRPQYFPRRNRIISGLSLGVLVVEAAKKSGSLLTANYAAEQGREVFAIPGSIHNPLAKGCHMLIRQGAKLVETVDDIVEELAPLLGFQADSQAFTTSKLGKRSSSDNSQQGQLPDRESAENSDHASDDANVIEAELTVEEQFLLNNLTDIPVSVDKLVSLSGYPVSVVSSLLVQMELKGVAQSIAGGYVLTGDA